MNLLIIILPLVPIFISVIAWLPKASRWLHERLTYKQFGIVSIDGVQETEELGQTTIRLAYAGTEPLLVRSVHLKLTLKYRGWRERTLAWLQIILAYLTNDIDSLMEFVGPQEIRLNHTLIMRFTNFIYGLSNLVFLLSQLVSPLGWALLFLSGPYDSREFTADGTQLHIKDAETGIERLTPFILEVNTAKEYSINYDYTLKTKHLVEGFPPNTRLQEVVHPVEHQPWWQLPRTGHAVWSAHGAIIIRIAGKWVKYEVPLAPRLVRLVPPTQITTPIC